LDLGIDGRRAAVPGASQGLGFETARSLAEEGVQVAICGRDAARIEAAAKQIGPRAVPIVAEVSDPEGAVGFVERAREALGGIDILIANTGGPPPGAAADVEVEQMRAALDLSLLAMMALCQETVPAMREAGWGRVVGITSIGVREPLSAMVYSNTARAGLTGYLKTLAGEVAADGVTVNSLLPGGHDTERLRSLMGEHMEAMSATIPARRLGRAADFGKIAAFLCSEHAGYLTGTTIPVAGGAQSGL
jgi:3-oxoacyl-[acyl-carrier protein] reductase